MNCLRKVRKKLNPPNFISAVEVLAYFRSPGFHKGSFLYQMSHSDTNTNSLYD